MLEHCKPKLMKDLNTIKLKMLAPLREHDYFKSNGQVAKIKLNQLNEIELNQKKVYICLYLLPISVIRLATIQKV